MKELSILFLFFFFIDGLSFSQIAVNKDGTIPDNSAMLDVNSNTGGFLLPRLTLVQRDAIQNPAEGLMVFCTDCGKEGAGAVSVFINGKWRLISSSCPLPVAPVAGVHISTATQITWVWEVVTGATGYKWNTTNNYSSATDMATATSKTETGLSPGNTYTRYVWAYNLCGNSAATSLVQGTPVCGSPFTIDHVAGAVAPVTKSVTYGTVANIPGELQKCWITKNLGASQQASAQSDATEASAGWYWQFNRKQGFKHDGTTRTPNTTWIDNILENSNWLIANDPCALELGSPWRMPTNTEWTNVYAAGGWSNWNGPWNSGLKLHAAGNLFYATGQLLMRGSTGFFWSSTESYDYWGFRFYFNSNYCLTNGTTKTNGFSLRCLREANNFAPILTTAAVTNIGPTSATSGGNITTDGGAAVTERGVCWSLNENPSLSDSHTTDGSGSGVFISALSGLTADTTYFVRAYAVNSVGTSYGNEVNFYTGTWPCGTSLTVYHVAGTIAPVTKTIRYGTVTNIPGEPSKCWITSNLGADHQATAVNDATEASAGWYWQFNHKQGFKHDGTTRTPNTAWLNSVPGTVDWEAANDPCTIEMGAGWHIPTFTEWTNVSVTGGWANSNNAWASGLRLHTAGSLSGYDGTLTNRGFFGHYWSRTKGQLDGSGCNLFFWDGECGMSLYSSMSNGFPVRCITDEGK